MGKFGGFSAGNIGGAFSKALNSTGITSKIEKLTGDLETKMNSMSPEELNGMMEKATIGNLASLVGGKAGIDIDASKIDGVVNRITETRLSIRQTIVNTVLGVAEKAGYSITLPNEESITKFIESSGLMNKIEGLGDDVGTEKIEELVKGIDIKKTATDLGLIVEKVPTKFDSVTDANKTLSEKVSNVESAFGELGKTVAPNLSNIAGDITSALGDIKDITTKVSE